MYIKKEQLIMSIILNNRDSNDSTDSTEHDTPDISRYYSTKVSHFELLPDPIKNQMIKIFHHPNHINGLIDEGVIQFINNDLIWHGDPSHLNDEYVFDSSMISKYLSDDFLNSKSQPTTFNILHRLPPLHMKFPIHCKVYLSKSHQTITFDSNIVISEAEQGSKDFSVPHFYGIKFGSISLCQVLYPHALNNSCFCSSFKKCEHKDYVLPPVYYIYDDDPSDLFITFSSFGNDRIIPFKKNLFNLNERMESKISKIEFSI